MIIREYFPFTLFWGIIILSLLGASSIRLTVMELSDDDAIAAEAAGEELQQQQQQTSTAASSSGALAPSKSLMEKAHDLFVGMIYKSEIPGLPGKDYPILADIPNTQFRCQDHSNVGYYADVESGCQVIHVCLADGSHESFLCPNGTIFNQQYFVCDWWFNVDCNDSPTYYDLNGGFGKVSEKNYYQEPSEKVAEKDYFEESRIVEVKREGDPLAQR